MIAKSLTRLSREKLIDLCISWSKSSNCDPYLTSNRNFVESEEEDYLHESAHTRNELNNVYSAFKSDGDDLHSLSKRDIIDRIVDGDWRRGLSYQQLASIDFACLEENDTSLRWTALKLSPMTESNESYKADNGRPAKRRKIEYSQSTRALPAYPDTTPAIFVQNLKKHISPLVKAHYQIHRLQALKLSIVRLYITPNTPFAPLSMNVPRQGKSATDSARTIFIALPDSCPHVYVSVSGAGSATSKSAKNGAGTAKVAHKVDISATKRIVLEAIPKALSRPQQRWSLEPTRLTIRSLKAMCLLRGSGKVGSAGGSISKFAQPGMVAGDPQEQSETQPNGGDQLQIEHEQNVEARFGNLDSSCHAKVDRVQLRVRDLFASQSKSTKKRKFVDDGGGDNEHNELGPIMITFSGTDVFAGLKQFAMEHHEFVDLTRLPAALTGEGNMSSLVL